LYRDGYVVVRNAVPIEKVEVALRAINKELGRGNTF
jgi:hypothetical protein